MQHARKLEGDLSGHVSSQCRHELLLLRHGKAEQQIYIDDVSRSLTDRGQRNTHRIASYIQDKSLLPDYIISSPATRTMQTAEIICNDLGISPQTIQAEETIYQAEVSDLLQVIAKLPEQYFSVLLVGHNPGIEELLEQLCPKRDGLQTEQMILPSTLIRIDLDTSWSNIGGPHAQLVSIMHSKML